MKRISIIKAMVAIAIVMTFVMPVAAFANVGTMGAVPNNKNTVDINNGGESIMSDARNIADTFVVEKTVVSAVPLARNCVC